MFKRDLLNHLHRVATASTTRKRLNLTHVRAITEELYSVCAKSLEDKGSASLPGFGRFDVHKRTGSIRFTPYKSFRDQIGGEVSTSLMDDENEESTQV